MDKKLTRRGLVQAGLGGIAVASQTGAVLAQAPAQPGALTTAPTSQAGLGPRLTMHAIDIFHGTPAAGMKVDLSRLDGDRFKPIKSVETAPNGRTAEPLLVDDALVAGRYEALFHFEDYFRKYDVKLPTPNFLSTVPVRFVIVDVKQRYHLPLLFSPWGYSYYRGS